MSYLNFITTSTCHGQGTESLMEGLLMGPGPLQKNSTELSPYFSNSEIKTLALEMAKAELSRHLTEMETIDFPRQGRWGLILASTKGIIDDLIWQADNLDFDTFSPLLHLLEEQLPFPIKKKITISNACTSSHAAIELGQKWLNRQWVDHIFIFGFDKMGPFTLKGFETLRALSPDAKVRPFDQNRNGLLLGNGVASCVLSNQAHKSSILINPVQSLCEGVSATRPDTSGVNLETCYLRACQQTPDLILAHGTGTFYNDATESKAIFNAFSSSKVPPVTCSKWSTGHSLGVSGLIDLGLTSEIFRQQRAPGIKTLEDSDLEIRNQLLSDPMELKVDHILISSLGFGGMCSALSVRSLQS